MFLRFLEYEWNNRRTLFCMSGYVRVGYSIHTSMKPKKSTTNS